MKSISEIKKDNKKFEKMTSSQKRVAIARDVLEQLRIKRFKAFPGTWVSNQKNTSYKAKSPDSPVESLFSKNGKKEKCNVCGIGALFVCAVEKFNELKVNELRWHFNGVKNIIIDAIYVDDVFDYLKKYFDSEQLKMIETAFEKGNTTFHSDEAADFYKDITSAEDRMRLIMENIVVNKGRFVMNEKMKPIINFTTPGFKE